MVKNLKLERCVYTLAIVLGLYMASFFAINTAFAAPVYSIEQNSDTINLQGKIFGQTFQPVSDYIGGVNLKAGTAYTPPNLVDIYLCIGTITSTADVTALYNNQDQPCYGGFLTASTSCSISSSGTDCNFDRNYAVTIGADYYFYASSTQAAPNIDYRLGGSNPYANGSFFRINDGGLDVFYNGGYDAVFKIYSDDELGYAFEDIGDVIVGELPDYNGNIQLGSDTLLQYNSTTFCYVGDPCYLYVNYGYDAIGATLNLLDFETLAVIASTTLGDAHLLQGAFIITDPETDTTQYYCLNYINDSDSYLYCDLEVVWTDTHTWCGETEVCSDISVGTNEFLYGMNCGLRRGICWAFKPTANSITFFAHNIENFENSFPFNTVFDIFNSIDLAYDQASTTEGGEFGMPMWDGTEWYTATGVDRDSWNDMLGTSTTAKLKLYANYVAWSFFGIGVILVVWKFGII